MHAPQALPRKRFSPLPLTAGLLVSLIPGLIAAVYAWQSGARVSSLDHVPYSPLKSALVSGLVIYVYPPFLALALIIGGILLARRPRTRAFGVGLAISPLMVVLLIALVQLAMH